MSDFTSPTGIDWAGHVGNVQYGNDQNKVVMFYTRPKHNPAKSTQAGRPMYDDVVYVRIHPPGERLNIVDRPVVESDKRQYPLQWAQFSQNKEQIPDGTPIEMLYPDHPAIGATLRASGVHTVEQCAELSGPAIDAIGMGAQHYSNDAKKYIEVANKGVKGSELRRELEERDSQIRTLTKTVDSLKTEVNRLRDLNMANVDLKAVQKLLAGQQLQPTLPNQRQMDPAFDAQTAQINATDPRVDIVRAVSKRTRARIKG